MLPRSLVLGCICLLAGPALAGDQAARLDALVTLLTGIADGATVNVGHGSVSPVNHIGPGHYEVVVDRTGATMSFEASEPRFCVLQLEILRAGQPLGGGMRLDLNHVTGIDIHPLAGEVPSHVLVSSGEDYHGPLNGIAVVLEGTGDVLQASPDGIASTPMAPHATFITSLAVKDVQSAVQTLRADCPGRGN